MYSKMVLRFRPTIRLVTQIYRKRNNKRIVSQSRITDVLLKPIKNRLYSIHLNMQL